MGSWSKKSSKYILYHIFIFKSKKLKYIMISALTRANEERINKKLEQLKYPKKESRAETRDRAIRNYFNLLVQKEKLFEVLELEGIRLKFLERNEAPLPIVDNHGISHLAISGQGLEAYVASLPECSIEGSYSKIDADTAVKYVKALSELRGYQIPAYSIRDEVNEKLEEMFLG